MIKNSSAMNVKNSLKKEVIESQASYNKYFFEDIINISQKCIITDIFRFKTCQPDQFYRPSISFITTKENAAKLKYLENQEQIFNYLIVDYDKVKYSEKNSYYKLGPDVLANNNIGNNEDKVKQYLLRFKKNRNLYESIIVKETGLDGSLKLEIPLHIGRREFKLDGKVRFDDIVKNEIKIFSDYYYKTEIFDFFKLQVQKKLQTEINLNNWSYCTVFSPLWCSETYIKKNNEKSLNFMNKLINRFNMIGVDSNFNNLYSSNLNYNTDKYNTDLKMLFFIGKCFESPPVFIKTDYDKFGSIDNFNVLIHAFENFQNGGYWIKKLILKNKKYIEEVIGPYSKEEGEKKVKILKNATVLKKAEVASLYTFPDLVCNYDIINLEYKKNINKYVNQKDLYSPYQGSLIFCLVNNLKDIVYFKKETLTEKFRKFHDYSLNYGMRVLNCLDHLIYFNPNNKKSIVKATQLKYILNNKTNYTPDNLIWLIDSILGEKIIRGKEPNSMPFEISEENEKNGKITYEDMIKIYDSVKEFDCDGEKLDFAFDQFKIVFENGYVDTYKNEEGQLKTEINTGIVINEDDSKPKKFKIVKNYKGKYELYMKRKRDKFKDIDIISVTEIEDCIGFLNINFKNMKEKNWDVSIMEIFSGDLNFNNEVSLIMITLFVAKCFGIYSLMLDTRFKSTECDKNIFLCYYVIYYLGKGSFNKFKDIGFVVRNEKKYLESISHIKDVNLRTFLIENKTKIKVPVEIKDLTVSQFCSLFLESKKCLPKNYLSILRKICIIAEDISKLEIFVILDKLTFDFIENYISYPEL